MIKERYGRHGSVTILNVIKRFLVKQLMPESTVEDKNDGIVSQFKCK